MAEAQSLDEQDVDPQAQLQAQMQRLADENGSLRGALDESSRIMRMVSRLHEELDTTRALLNQERRAKGEVIGELSKSQQRVQALEQELAEATSQPEDKVDPTAEPDPVVEPVEKSTAKRRGQKSSEPGAVAEELLTEIAAANGDEPVAAAADST